MKVNIGPYTNWVGPYQIAEKILFWMDKDRDKRVFKFGEFLAHGFHTKEDSDKMFNDDRPTTWLYDLCTWIHKKQKRKVEIKIDRYDTWSMDSTLAMIALPMLKQLKATKHGAPNVDDKDVPKGLSLRSTEAPPKENEWDVDGNHFKRWDWVLDEMIWAFEQLQPDSTWEDQYHSGEHDLRWKKSDKTYPNPITGEEECTYEMYKGPDDTHVFNQKGYELHNKRIDNGLKLFGKYYRSLWD